MKMDRRGRKGVSVIIATLLLIAISVAAGIIVYDFVNGLAGGLTSSNGSQVTQQLQLQAYAFYPVSASGFTAAGTSGTGTPAWTTTIAGTTADGPVSWRNLGAIASFSLPTAGGTSGIIMDNTVVGDSQVYFSTQGNQTCVTSGTPGGCAIQASQSALQ